MTVFTWRPGSPLPSGVHERVFRNLAGYGDRDLPALLLSPLPRVASQPADGESRSPPHPNCFANAADELAADSHSPLVLQQLAATQQKLGNAEAAEATRKALKYHRSSEPDWYLATHNGAPNSN
jgi:hypothetical protein